MNALTSNAVLYALLTLSGFTLLIALTALSKVFVEPVLMRLIGSLPVDQWEIDTIRRKYLLLTAKAIYGIRLQVAIREALPLLWLLPIAWMLSLYPLAAVNRGQHRLDMGYAFLGALAFTLLYLERWLGDTIEHLRRLDNAQGILLDRSISKQAKMLGVSNLAIHDLVMDGPATMLVALLPLSRLSYEKDAHVVIGILIGAFVGILSGRLILMRFVQRFLTGGLILGALVRYWIPIKSDKWIIPTTLASRIDPSFEWRQRVASTVSLTERFLPNLGRELGSIRHPLLTLLAKLIFRTRAIINSPGSLVPEPSAEVNSSLLSIAIIIFGARDHEYYRSLSLKLQEIDIDYEAPHFWHGLLRRATWVDRSIKTLDSNVRALAYLTLSVLIVLAAFRGQDLRNVVKQLLE